eukprot:scaffold26848_cov183-Amphora_coffeaeformis.AAC.2
MVARERQVSSCLHSTVNAIGQEQLPSSKVISGIADDYNSNENSLKVAKEGIAVERSCYAQRPIINNKQAVCLPCTAKPVSAEAPAGLLLGVVPSTGLRGQVSTEAQVEPLSRYPG